MNLGARAAYQSPLPNVSKGKLCALGMIFFFWVSPLIPPV